MTTHHKPCSVPIGSVWQKYSKCGIRERPYSLFCRRSFPGQQYQPVSLLCIKWEQPLQPSCCIARYPPLYACPQWDVDSVRTAAGSRRDHHTNPPARWRSGRNTAVFTFTRYETSCRSEKDAAGTGRRPLQDRRLTCIFTRACACLISYISCGGALCCSLVQSSVSRIDVQTKNRARGRRRVARGIRQCLPSDWDRAAGG